LRFFEVLSTFLLMLGIAASASGAELILRHDAVNGAYLPGMPLDVTIHVDHDGAAGAVSALAIEETLPPGWEFEAVLLPAAPPDVIAFGGALVFNFVNLPETPFDLVYRVRVPGDAQGLQSFTASAIYRLSDGELRSPPVTNTFTEGVFALTVAVEGPGTVLPKLGAIPFAAADGIILEAVSSRPDYVFSYWSGLNNSGENPLPLFVAGESAITAVFVPLHRVSIAVLGEGAVSPAPGEYDFPEGTRLNLRATPAPGWRFKGWQGLIEGADPEFQYAVNDNGYILARFVQETVEGEVEGAIEGEGASEGEGEGEETGVQTADGDGDSVISLSELLRVIQFYNSGGLHCVDTPGDTEDGYVPGPGLNQACTPHDTDYDPEDWFISLSELLRTIQFYNSLGYNYCPEQDTEDGFCPGAA
jgi:hypothetical protein